jgi:hypothetical protein
MKFSLIVLAVVIASVSASRLLNEKLNAQWEEFKAQHGKSYANEDETTRCVGFRRVKKRRKNKLKQFASYLTDV